MNWPGLFKHLFAFGSSAVDVGSDVANGLNFLGVFNDNEMNRNITSVSLTNLADPITNTSEVPMSADNETINCAAIRQRKDLIWGILSLGIVFLPGFIAGIMLILDKMGKEKQGWIWFLFWILLLTPISSVAFPFAFLFLHLSAVIKICQNKEVNQKDQLQITQYTGHEAAIESIPQLLLQLFTIFNGYPSTSLQWVTITASFFQLARCSIINDIETRIVIMGGKELTFKESLAETMYRSPLYLSTIIFRVGSLSITMSYLRYYSIIPIAVLYVLQAMVAWTRFKTLNDRDFATRMTNRLVIGNIGVFNAFTFNTQSTVGATGTDIPLEDEQDVVDFIKNSTLAGFIHHSAVLIIIMIVGSFFPSAMDHWSSQCNFPLKPGMQSFYWLFGTLIFMGFYSLTSIMYRADRALMVHARAHKPPLLKDAKGYLDEAYRKESGSKNVDR